MAVVPVVGCCLATCAACVLAEVVLVKAVVVDWLVVACCGTGVLLPDSPG